MKTKQLKPGKNGQQHPLTAQMPVYTYPPRKDNTDMMEKIGRHAWSKNIKADDFEAIQSTERLLSHIIEQASLNTSCHIKYADFLYDSMCELRDHLLQIVQPNSEPF